MKFDNLYSYDVPESRVTPFNDTQYVNKVCRSQALGTCQPLGHGHCLSMTVAEIASSHRLLPKPSPFHHQRLSFLGLHQSKSLDHVINVLLL